MLKKILPLVIIGVLLTNGIGAVVSYSENSGSTTKFTLSFPSLDMQEYDSGYLEARLENTLSYVTNPGCPMLPKIVKTVELKFGVQNVRVEVIPKILQEYSIERKIRPAPVLVPLAPTYITNRDKITRSWENEAVYTGEQLYPSAWYTYRVGCGLNAENERVTHVAIHIFPVRYSPLLGKLYAAGGAEVTITYEKPEAKPSSTNGAYDMVIISPSVFSGELQRLVDHKNDHGVKTVLKTTDEIYSEYSGVDKPEQIKYFIKDAIETWDIKYVLLVGGLKSLIWAKPRDNANEGSERWHVPVRYTNLYDNPKYPLDVSTIHDPGVLCDLYYADVYKEGGIFEDWDPNNDGIFAAWNKPGVENDTDLDFYPDVAVGRLACRNIKEVRTVVDKIITYEQNPCDPSWFKKMTVISGDGFLDQQDLDFQWDTNSLPNGEYTIYAQSTNDEDESGPID
ncbi:MAG: C25 family cysteine peptidase, partial [Candidatus Thermoplasmatota archaeon]|nr:C25 family cysteine peptidase [Candidatus Thermoplasmatota archaeon]